MWHMPYERMNVEDDPDDTPDTLSTRDAAAEPYGEPGRTPLSAEGGSDEEERKMPLGEPGRTPGSAEGEDFEEPSRG